MSLLECTPNVQMWLCVLRISAGVMLPHFPGSLEVGTVIDTQQLWDTGRRVLHRKTCFTLSAHSENPWPVPENPECSRRGQRLLIATEESPMRWTGCLCWSLLLWPEKPPQFLVNCLSVHKPESSSLVPMLEGGGAQCWPQEFSGGPEVQGLFVSRQHCFLNAQGFLI